MSDMEGSFFLPDATCWSRTEALFLLLDDDELSPTLSSGGASDRLEHSLLEALTKLQEERARNARLEAAVAVARMLAGIGSHDPACERVLRSVMAIQSAFRPAHARQKARRTAARELQRHARGLLMRRELAKARAARAAGSICAAVRLYLGTTLRQQTKSELRRSLLRLSEAPATPRPAEPPACCDVASDTSSLELGRQTSLKEALGPERQAHEAAGFKGGAHNGAHAHGRQAHMHERRCERSFDGHHIAQLQAALQAEHAHLERAQRELAVREEAQRRQSVEVAEQLAAWRAQVLAFEALATARQREVRDARMVCATLEAERSQLCARLHTATELVQHQACQHLESARVRDADAFHIHSENSRLAADKMNLARRLAEVEEVVSKLLAEKRRLAEVEEVASKLRGAC